MRIIKIVLLLLLISGTSQAATTRYMAASGGDCDNLSACFSAMSAGDTLIIRSGTYTGSSNKIGSGIKPPTSSSTWTMVQAETPGTVFFGTAGTTVNHEYFSYEVNPTNAHWIFNGLIWYGGTYLGGTDYVKFLNCGAGGNAVNVGGDFIPFLNIDCDYLLYEDCFAWGGGRYKWNSYLSDHIIYRRCVGRLDATDTTHDGSKTEPVAIFAFYGTSNSEAQNCIAIDSDTREYWVFESLPGAFTTPNDGGDGVAFRGCIGLNVDMSFRGSAAGFSGTVVQNSIGWHLDAWYAPNGGSSTWTHMTMGDIAGDAIDGYSDGGDSATNSIFNAVDGTALYRMATSNYNYFYGNGTNYSSTSPGAQDVTNVNPRTNSLLYLPRIEAGSSLAGHASDGGNVGATVLCKIGTDGTLWGATGYATTRSCPLAGTGGTTADNLWPFPNEGIIKTNFTAYTSTNVTGARGFATGTSRDGSSQTLTKYIWEYLGNTIPSEVYSAGSDTAPATTTITSSNPLNVSASSATVTATCADETAVGGSKWAIGVNPDATHGTACGGTTSASCSVTGLASGNNDVRVACYDTSGNYDASPDTLTVNYTPPAVTVPLSGVILSGGKVTY